MLGKHPGDFWLEQCVVYAAARRASRANSSQSKVGRQLTLTTREWSRYLWYALHSISVAADLCCRGLQTSAIDMIQVAAQH